MVRGLEGCLGEVYDVLGGRPRGVVGEVDGQPRLQRGGTMWDDRGQQWIKEASFRFLVLGPKRRK